MVHRRTPTLVLLLCATCLATGLAAGCRSIQPPPVALQTQHGVVRAANLAACEEIATLLEVLGPAVSSQLPGCHDQDLEVWLRETLSPPLPTNSSETQGLTILGSGSRTPRIHLRSGEPRCAHTLAHELVHAKLDATWSSIPGVLEEGLADLLAERVLARCAGGTQARGTQPGEIRATRILHACGFFDHLALTVTFAGLPHPRVFHVTVDFEGDADPLTVPMLLNAGGRGELSRFVQDIEPRRIAHFYGVGYVLACHLEARIGFEGIHRLCADARRDGHALVPVERVLAAAGLQSPGKLKDAPSQLLGRFELEHLLEELPHAIQDPLVAVCVAYGTGERGGSIPGEDAIAFLARTQPHLVAANGERVPLATRLGFQRALGRLWPAR